MMKRLALLLLLILSGPAIAQTETFYKTPYGLFSTRPSSTASQQSIDRFGPVGIGIDLIQPAFVMRVKNVEDGSPADATGKLQKGQIIESINGQTLKDIDPRIQLGQILAKAEATDGKLTFKMKGLADPVVVTIPVLGAYSDTWPLNCPKSDKIVRDTVEYFAGEKAHRGFADIGLLFLVSTGEEQDLELARQWIHDGKVRSDSGYAWHIGYGGIGVCEYYLKTGDPKAMEMIQQMTDLAVGGQYLDGWAGRGGVPRVTYGNGHLNAAGTGVVAFLLLAKECGADVPDEAMLGALRHFYRYAGRGNNPYGDDRPEHGYVDNGKNGYLAFAMAAAAALTPNGEDSLYADARDWCANTSFYTTTYMLHGHTGGGIGEIWRSASMALMDDVRTNQYREFMDNRAWHYDLSRRFDGSFGILGGEGYDKTEWGMAFPLAYTLPRGHLRIAGAAPTKYSKRYELPKRIWGNAEDDKFLSLKPVAEADGTVADLSGETLASDSGRSVINALHRGKPVSDNQLRTYIRHPYSSTRYIAACKVVGINSGRYGQRARDGEIRPELALEFLMHPSPRVRREMLAAVANHGLNSPDSPLHTREVLGLAIEMLADEDESWWVKDAALHVVAKFPADWTRGHLDLLLSYLTHEEDWLKNAAMVALTPLAVDPQSYQRVLPPIGELVRTNQRWSLTSQPLAGLRAVLNEATTDIQQLAIETLAESFTGYTGVDKAPGGQDISTTRTSHLEFIAASLADVPGGVNALYEISRKQQPDEPLPYKDVVLTTPADEYGPALKRDLRPILLQQIIPAYVGKNRVRLRQYANGEIQSYRCGGRHPSVPGRASLGEVVDDLAALYKQAGETQYDWHMYMDLRHAKWDYFGFEVIQEERVPWDTVISRYREVTLPKGQEQWFAKDFDAPKAGWKRGQSPFGQYGGKIPTGPIMKCDAGCVGPVCFGATPVKTLWENEVLMFRGTFKLPKYEEGYRYRLRVNDGDHPGSGGGYIIYINGEQLIEQKTCNGRGHGMPKGAYITKDFFDDMAGQEITIAVQTFIRYNDKFMSKPSDEIRQGRISLHVERQKIPPMGDDLVHQSAALVPMRSSDWLAKQDRDNPGIDPEADKFRWDGKFVANKSVLGDWQVIGQVKTIDVFDHTAKRQPPARNARFKELSLKANGQTNDPAWLWSGNMLMDLTKYEAMKIQAKSVAGSDYLFIESGDFYNHHHEGWTSPWLVLTRKK